MNASESDGIVVRLNGRERKLASDTSVSGLLAQLGLDPTAVVVELDGDILEREQHPQRTLRAGAQVEIVHFVGGG